MKYAIIENGVVINIAKADSPISANWVLAGSAKRGDIWDGSVFTTPSKTPAELLSIEVSWVTTELGDADKEVLKHDDSHGRVTGTKPQWRTYRNALRDHVIDGVVMGGRPPRPI